MDIELTELRREFLEEAEAKIVEIRSYLDGNESTPSDESVKRMGDLAHQLKGAGGSYGYSEISSHAAKLEDAIESYGEGGGEEASALGSLVDALGSEISDRRHALSEESS